MAYPPKMIRNVPPDVAAMFASQAERLGLTQAQYLERLVSIVARSAKQ